MTTMELLQPRLRPFAAARCVPESGGGVTLQERLDGAWRSLDAHGVSECPVCHARMTMKAGAGQCGGCGARLS